MVIFGKHRKKKSMTATSRSSWGFVRTVSLGITLGAATVALLWAWQSKQTARFQTEAPIEQALWVSNWDVTKVYGPGTPEQTAVVAALEKESGLGDIRFGEPILIPDGSGKRQPSRRSCDLDLTFRSSQSATGLSTDATQEFHGFQVRSRTIENSGAVGFEESRPPGPGRREGVVLIVFDQRTGSSPFRRR